MLWRYKRIPVQEVYQNNTTYKIAVTYDSLPKLIGWLSGTEGWKVLIDEYHLILEDMDFRYDAINGLMEEIQKFRHYSFCLPLQLTLTLR